MATENKLKKDAQLLESYVHASASSASTFEHTLTEYRFARLVKSLEEALEMARGIAIEHAGKLGEQVK